MFAEMKKFIIARPRRDSDEGITCPFCSYFLPPRPGASSPFPLLLPASFSSISHLIAPLAVCRPSLPFLSPLLYTLSSYPPWLFGFLPCPFSSCLFPFYFPLFFVFLSIPLFQSFLNPDNLDSLLAPARLFPIHLRPKPWQSFFRSYSERDLFGQYFTFHPSSGCWGIPLTPLLTVLTSPLLPAVSFLAKQPDLSVQSFFRNLTVSRPDLTVLQILQEESMTIAALPPPRMESRPRRTGLLLTHYLIAFLMIFKDLLLNYIQG